MKRNFTCLVLTIVLIAFPSVMLAEKPVDWEPPPGQNCYTIVTCHCETDPKTGIETCYMTAEEICE